MFSLKFPLRSRVFNSCPLFSITFPVRSFNSRNGSAPEGRSTAPGDGHCRGGSPFDSAQGRERKPNRRTAPTPAPEWKGSPKCSFVFMDIPASFLQKSVPPSNCSSLPRVGGSKDATANKSHLPCLRALFCQESCVFIEILASFADFPQRPFVFNNVPGSFVQKKSSRFRLPLAVEGWWRERCDCQQATFPGRGRFFLSGVRLGFCVAFPDISIR